MQIKFLRVVLLILFLLDCGVGCECISMRPDSLRSVQLAIVHCDIRKMNKEYVGVNIKSFEEISNDISAISPCAQVILGIYYLEDGKIEEATKLLASGCDDKYEGYYYALQYLDNSSIEEEGLADYSENNATRLLEYLLSSYQSKTDSSEEIYRSLIEEPKSDMTGSKKHNEKPPRKINRLEKEDKEYKKLGKEDQTLLQNTGKKSRKKGKIQKKMVKPKLKDSAADEPMEIICEN